MADKPKLVCSEERFTPKIVYVRLGKDLTKDGIQKKIIKAVNNAFNGSVNGEGQVGIKEKPYQVFPMIKSEEVCEVAIGPEFIGIVLNNGRVGRIKCSSSTMESSKKPSKSLANKKDDIFQVQSDEVYARQLQDQLNSGELRSQSSTLNVNYNSPLFPSSEEVLISEVAESLCSDINILSTNANQTLSCPSVEGFDAINRNPEATNSTSNTSSDSLESEKSTSKRTLLGKSQTEQNREGTTQNPFEQTASEITLADVFYNTDTQNQLSKQTNETNKESVVANVNSKVVSNSSEACSSTSTNSKLINSSKAMQSNAATPGKKNTTQTQSDDSFYPQASVSSPTFIQRTVFHANPFFYRPPRVLCRGPSGALYNFDSRRLRDTFGQQRAIRYQPQGSTVHHFGPTVRNASGRSNFNRRDRGQAGSNGGRSSEDEENAKFFYPKLGELEWLMTESVSISYHKYEQCSTFYGNSFGSIHNVSKNNLCHHFY